MAESELKDKTAKGLFWGGFSSGLRQVISLFFGIFLSRLLSPGDYGMVGMLAIFAGLANALQEGGFIAALTNKKNPTREDFNAVFWFNILVGTAIYLVLFFSAPLIASFFGHEELLPLSRFLFLGFLFGCFGTAHSAYMYKYIMAKERAKVDLISLLVSNVAAVIMAYFGMSYWGIAIQTVLYALTNTLLRWVYSPWRPTLLITLKPIGEFFGFSIKLLLTNIINQISSNVFSLLLGRFYAVPEVGYYTQGNKWMGIGSGFTSNMVTGIAQPIISQVINDKQREIKVFHKMVRFISFISFPIMFGLAIVAEELIVLTITDKWLPAVSILQILCVWGAFLPIGDLYRHLAMSHGKSGFTLYSYLLLSIAQLAVLILMLGFGIQTMVKVYVCTYFVWLAAWQIFAKKVVGIRFVDVIRDVIPYLGATALSLGIGWIVSSFAGGMFFKLLLKVVVSGVSYIFIMKFSGSVLYKESIMFLRGKFLSRF